MGKALEKAKNKVHSISPTKFFENVLLCFHFIINCPKFDFK